MSVLTASLLTLAVIAVWALLTFGVLVAGDVLKLRLARHFGVEVELFEFPWLRRWHALRRSLARRRRR